MVSGEGGIDQTMKIPQVSFQALSGLARAARSAGRILRIDGGPGIGKTAAFEGIGAALGIPAARRLKVNLSGASPSEASGFAAFANGGLEWLPPSWLPLSSVVGDDPFLLFLDEFPDWDASVQALFRSVVDPDGVPAIGPHKLPAGLVLVLSGNRATDGSRTSRTISAPITSRALTVELVPDRNEVLDYLADHAMTGAWQFVNFMTPEQAAGLFAPPVPAPWDGAPFPTPRGWQAAMEVESSGLGLDVLRVAWHGILGEDAGAALWAFARAVGQWSGLVADIKAGDASIDDTDALKASAVAAASVRIAVRDSLRDPAAAVAGGAVDWLVDRVLSKVGRERGEAGYRAAIASGLPLDMHPRAAQFDSSL